MYFQTDDTSPDHRFCKEQQTQVTGVPVWKKERRAVRGKRGRANNNFSE